MEHINFWYKWCAKRKVFLIAMRKNQSHLFIQRIIKSLPLDIYDKLHAINFAFKFMQSEHQPILFWIYALTISLFNLATLPYSLTKCRSWPTLIFYKYNLNYFKWFGVTFRSTNKNLSIRAVLQLTQMTNTKFI